MKLELESKLVVSMSVKELLVCVKSKKIEEETLGKCSKTFPPEFDYRRYALPYALRSKWLHKSECTKVA